MDFLNLNLHEVGTLVAEPLLIVLYALPVLILVLVISLIWNR